MADLLIVDDHSLDGSVDYLVKRGYHVASKEVAKGLTDSWNFGYRFAKELGYKYLVFANNDVLIPVKALDVIKQQLLKNSLVFFNQLLYFSAKPCNIDAKLPYLYKATTNPLLRSHKLLISILPRL